MNENLKFIFVEVSLINKWFLQCPRLAFIFLNFFFFQIKTDERWDGAWLVGGRAFAYKLDIELEYKMPNACDCL